MKYYLEIIETVDELSPDLPQMMRVEVANKAEAEAELPNYEPNFAGLDYVKQFHICKHAGGQPCEAEAL